MTEEIRTYSELKAHYIAVRKRLGGLGPSAGLVPLAAVPRPAPPPPKPEVEAEKPKIIYAKPPIPKGPFFHIMMEVAEKHEVDPNSLIGRNRRQKIVWIRRELIWRAVKEAKYPILWVARYLQKDHTTIIHDLREWERRYAA